MADLKDTTDDSVTGTTGRHSREHFAGDAQPDPEPAAPSLGEPDAGVFHHEPKAQTTGQ